MANPLRVLFFASLRDAVGAAELQVEAPLPETLEGLWPVLRERLGPAAVQALQEENVRIAINQELAVAPIRFAAGDEIAFLPPVTGG